MKIKICGVTHPKDAEHAARLGADYIGLIFSSASKRSVCVSQAKEISLAAKQYGAQSVGIFVDEPLEQLLTMCQLAEIDTVQLHGQIVHEHLIALQDDYPIIYAISVNADGAPSQASPICKNVLPLFDYQAGGSGASFDWKRFCPPTRTPWMLAGGLTPSNVSQAIRLLKPHGVDCASGVQCPSSTRKDPFLIEAFIQAVKETQKETR